MIQVEIMSSTQVTKKAASTVSVVADMHLFMLY